MCPKTTLILIKIAKILESKGIFVVFESASQATWSRLLRFIRGGFIQIPEEFMTNPVLEDFRQDFGLANPDLPKNPTIMDILGPTKLHFTTYRYTPGKEGTITMNNQHRPMRMNYVEQKFYESFYLHLDHAVDAVDLIILQNDHREPVVEVLIQLEGNTIQGDIQNVVGQMVPGWETERTRYSQDGNPYYNKVNGELDRSQTVKCKSGLPKAHLAMHANMDRMHMVNVAAQLETIREDQNEVRLRILDPNYKVAGRRKKLWKERKAQINKHLHEDEDICQQMDIEMTTFMNPLQSFSHGKFQGPKYQGVMPPEFKKAMRDGKDHPDHRVKDRTNAFENEVRATFEELERTMKHVRLPTSKGTRYHTGLSTDVFEQPEKPGLANIHTANHDRFMKVLTQLSYHGDYSIEEEQAIDEEEREYIVVTEQGRNITRNDGHQRSQNQRLRRQSISSNSEYSSITAKTITAPEGSNITRPLSERTPFSEHGTDNESSIQTSYTESVATEEFNSEEWSESRSTISEGTIREGSEFIFEYEEDGDQSSQNTTICDFRQGLPRPKTGWNTSSFPSFGTLVPACNNSILLPQAPKTARLYWNVATGGQFGHNSGMNDEEYLNRIEHVMAPRINSRKTTENIKNILAKRPDLFPRNSNWATLTAQAWQEKFPDSSILPDTAFQYSRDPNLFPILPLDLFAEDDIEWLRQRPLSETYQNQRRQQPVSLQGKMIKNNSY